MAYLEGRELADDIAAGPMELDRILDLVPQFAEGLSEAHTQGFVHRDIKPANLFVTPSGRGVILDFGLAQLASADSKLTGEDTTLGTCSYMSPEQARGGEVDARTDVWALGVVLYEMVSGQLPFPGHYHQAIIHSVLNEEPPPLTDLRPGLPVDLERIAEKCMAKRPDQRYHSVGDLLAELRALRRKLESGETTQRPSAAVREPFTSIIFCRSRTAAAMKKTNTSLTESRKT